MIVAVPTLGADELQAMRRLVQDGVAELREAKRRRAGTAELKAREEASGEPERDFLG